MNLHSLIDGAKHLVIEEEDPKTVPIPATKPVIAESVQAVEHTYATPASSHSTVDAGEVDEFAKKLRFRLDAALSNRPLSEFMATVKSLGEFIADERQLYKAALKSRAQQVSALTDSIRGALQAIHTEQERFGDAVTKEVQERIAPAEASVASLNKSIAGKQQELQLLIEQRDGAAADVVSRRQVVDQKRAAFEQAVVVVTSEVNATGEKIRQYLS